MARQKLGHKKSLRGIKRVSLEPGEKRKVSFRVSFKELAFFDVDQKKKVVEPGFFEIGNGASSDDLMTKKFEVVE